MRKKESMTHPGEPIAIIGMGCRFPGNVTTPQQFWQLLIDGIDAVREFPASRGDLQPYYHPDPNRPGKIYTRQGGFLEHCDLFDAGFFGISAIEAKQMDPQQRLLLEASWEALEDAGIVPSQLAGSPTSVFVGICSTDYKITAQRANCMTINGYTNSGGTCSIAANRLSYFFDFRGPSLSIDTACSSSLTGVHLACKSLWDGDCSLALAAGVNLILDPILTIGFCQAHMISPRDRCHAFDAGADGYVRGEGAGVVILKPLSQALADGNPVYATILATCVNQDGKTPAGMLQPGQETQEALLRQVYSQAGIASHQVCYIEAHGTGTPIGDPIECQAIGNVLGKGRPDGEYLPIGSVKTNIGHLEGASGIAGLMKAALVLKHCQIPPNLHFCTPNPNIPFEDLHLKVPQQVIPLPADTTPLIAGVNNFGFGGTNAHAILQAFPTPVKPREGIGKDKPPYLLPLSARSTSALRDLARDYQNLLDDQEQPTVRDLCANASLRREHHPYRLGVVAHSREALWDKLDAFLADEKTSGLCVGSVPAPASPQIAFVFSGNGPQWWAMGRQLLDQEPLFHTIIARCDQALRQYSGWSLLEELQRDEAHSQMYRTDIAQPALFALQIGLVALLQSWGIEPQTVIGHSVGEVAAAYVAGILTFEEAVKVIFHRCRLQETTAGKGKMLAVSLPAEEARALLVPYEGEIELAAINSPSAVTFTGKEAALEEVMTTLEQKGVFCRFLPLNYAFHSHFMDPTHDELLNALRDLHPQPASIPFISTVKGHQLIGTECGAEYWWNNVRQPVQFAAGVACLLQNAPHAFLEIGPHPVLSAYIAECSRNAERRSAMVPTLHFKENERTTLLTSLATLYTHGCRIAWHNLVEAGVYVDLPHYPWQYERYWVESDASSPMLGTSISLQRVESHPLLGYRLPTIHPTWEKILDIQLLPYLADHQVHKTVVFPAAGYIEMVLAAAREVFEGKQCVLEHIEIRKPLLLSHTQATHVQLTLVPDDSSFSISSRQATDPSTWTTHVAGRLLPLKQERATGRVDLQAQQTRCQQIIDGKTLYKQAALRGLHYGPCFQGVECIATGKHEALGTVRWPAAYQEITSVYRAHPILLDSCFQIIFALFASEEGEQQYLTHLPVGMERIRYFSPLHAHTHISSAIQLIKQRTDYCLVDCLMLDEEGHLLMEITGMRLQATRFSEQKLVEEHLYQSCWYPAPRQSNAPSPLPALTHLIAQVSPTVELWHHHLLSDEAYQQRNHLFEQVSAAYFFKALRTLGAIFTVGAHFTVRQLREQTGILEQHDLLLTALCHTMASDGLLILHQDEWQVAKAPDETEPEEIWRQFARTYPDCHAEAVLSAHCGRHLPQVLRGEVDMLNLLFREEMAGTLEQFYESGLRTRQRNKLLQAFLKHLIDQFPTDRVLHILEIGAGTGATTNGLLPFLPAERVKYVFSDISEAFLQQARQKYRAYPFVHYQIVDIEQDPLSQGLKEQTFDLIIATNVIHATRNIAESLRHIFRLLAPGGFFSLSEEASCSSYMMLISFGTLKSYWRMEDRDLRPIQPLLHPKQWREALATTGFAPVEMLTYGERGDAPNQALLLAQAPQVVQQGEESPVLPSQTWILFADQTGVASQVKARLQAADQQLILVERAEQFQRLAPHHFQLNSQHSEDIHHLFETLKQEGLSCEHIVYLCGLDRVRGECTPQKLEAAVDAGCQGVLTCVQGMAKAEYSPAPRLWIVTGGTQAHDCAPEYLAIEQAPLYGLGRTLHNEMHDLRCTLIDISPPTAHAGDRHYDPEDIQSLCKELLYASEAEEYEILVRRKARYINRMIPASLERPAQEVITFPETSFRLEMTAPDILDNLILRTIPRRRPGRGEVEIEIATTGLNFRDVMVAMGLISGEALELGYANGFSFGLECAGTIISVGEGVSDFQVGDEVIAIGRDCISAYVTTEAHLVMPKPEAMSFEEGATLLTTFLTAHYALHVQGRLGKGERVLIHGAAGGVGLAAIQVVQAAGGVIFATAGSPEKRAYLRALGCEYVFDSRSLAFADEIMQITNGEGIDIVLNSISGEAVAKSLSVLRRFGRFLEIGRRDFLERRKLGLRPFQYSLTYASIDLDQLCYRGYEHIKQTMKEVKERLDAGIYRPLPYRPFSLSQVKDAFRYMQQSKHIGKIVVTMKPALATVHHARKQTSAVFKTDASYLITGGASGFGLATASYLVERGARYLVLTNRSGQVSTEAAQEIERLRERGAHILIAASDVSQEDAVARLLEQIHATCPPLRGIIHAAMVLDECMVLNMSRKAFMKGIAPKVIGAWNLHVQTQDIPLDFLVFYSSIAAAFGNPAQSNYVAANLFFTALTSYRRARGLPALAVEWGPIAQVGFVARNADVLKAVERIGLRAFEPAQALSLLDTLLQHEYPVLTVADIDWQKLAASLDGDWFRKRWAAVISKDAADPQQHGQQQDMHTMLLKVPVEERKQIVQQKVISTLSRIMGQSLGSIDPETKGELGLDSLLAMELHNNIQHDLGVDLPIIKLLQVQSIADLTTIAIDLLVEKVSS